MKEGQLGDTGSKQDPSKIYCTGWFPQTGDNFEAADASCYSSLASGCFQIMGNSLTFAISAGWFRISVAVSVQKLLKKKRNKQEF